MEPVISAAGAALAVVCGRQPWAVALESVPASWWAEL
jgi:hypothetical protein